MFRELYTFHFTLSATPALNWRVLPLKESPTAQTGFPAARYGAAYFLRWGADHRAAHMGLLSINRR